MTARAIQYEEDATSIFGSAYEAIGCVAATTGKTLKVGAGSVTRTLGAGAYKAAYGVSFGVVFSGVFLTELLPRGNALRCGFEDGAEAALEAAAARRAESAAPRALPRQTRKASPRSAPKVARRKSVTKIASRSKKTKK